MIIKRCSQVSDRIIYDAFTEGFSDYMLKMNMDFDYFMHRFFYVEDNDKDLSYIALDQHKPLGVLLAGNKSNENLYTLRCGGMAVSPKSRKMGIAQRLMEAHYECAKGLGCKQVFLEVLKGNDRAIKLYEKLGYDKVYDLSYKVLYRERLEKSNQEFNIVKIDHEGLLKLKNSMIHMPWQSDFPYFAKLNTEYYGILEDDKLVAGVAYCEGNIYFIWVELEHRFKGYARALLNHVFDEHGLESLKFSFANNSELYSFAKYIGAEDRGFGQNEMYKWINK